MADDEDNNNNFVERTIGDWTCYQAEDGGVYYHNTEVGVIMLPCVHFLVLKRNRQGSEDDFSLNLLAVACEGIVKGQ